MMDSSKPTRGDLIVSENHCGSCTMCCKVMAIGDTFRGEPFRKDHGTWCQHCDVGVGCKVYEDRPETCFRFRCFWLEGKERGLPLPDELRPDRCHVVIAPTDDEMVWAAHVDANRTDAWRGRAIYPWLERAVRAGGKVVITAGRQTIKTVLFKLPNGTVGEARRRFTEPDGEKAIQRHIPGEKGKS